MLRIIPELRANVKQYVFCYSHSGESVIESYSNLRPKHKVDCKESEVRSQESEYTKDITRKNLFVLIDY